LTDLTPQLAEFDLRYEAGEFDTAAGVLLEIDFDYLMLWGHYRLALELHDRLQDHLSDPWTDSASKGNLGLCYSDLGETRRAIELYERALAIAQEIGNRQIAGAALGNLGNRYSDLGDTRRAIELHEQALAIAQEIGNRKSEANQLGNLGLCCSALGERRRAIELHERTLAIAQEIGNRKIESLDLINLGDCQADLAAWGQATGYCERAIAISDEIGFAQARHEGRLSLASVHLHAGELDAARETLRTTRAEDYPPTAAGMALILGIVLARQASRDAAREAFTDGVRLADSLLEQTSDNYSVLDTKALALCGIALVDGPEKLTEASSMFRAARAITRSPGTVRRVLRLFDDLALADPAGILEPIRHTAAGDDD
jgi:tetratricopeptide (TPR) repeat protein